MLILEERPYRYQAAISDLAGSDIQAHGGSHETAVRKVRNWIVGVDGFERIGATQVVAEYEDFQTWHYESQREAGFSDEDIRDYSTPELLRAMRVWTQQGRPRE